MDKIQSVLIKAGKKVLAQKYYEKIAVNPLVSQLINEVKKAVDGGKLNAHAILEVEVSGKKILVSGNLLRLASYLEDMKITKWKLKGYTSDRNESRKKAGEV